MLCFSSIGVAMTDSSWPLNCPVSDLEFINVLHSKENKEESLVKDVQTNLFLQHAVIALKSKHNPVFIALL